MFLNLTIFKHGRWVEKKNKKLNKLNNLLLEFVSNEFNIVNKVVESAFLKKFVIRIIFIFIKIIAL
jgi:hypothetical protein